MASPSGHGLAHRRASGGAGRYHRGRRERRGGRSREDFEFARRVGFLHSAGWLALQQRLDRAIALAQVDARDIMTAHFQLDLLIKVVVAHALLSELGGGSARRAPRRPPSKTGTRREKP